MNPVGICQSPISLPHDCATAPCACIMHRIIRFIWHYSQSRVGVAVVGTYLIPRHRQPSRWNRSVVTQQEHPDILSVLEWRHHETSWCGNFFPLLTFCEGNPPVTGVFPSQRVGSAQNVIWDAMTLIWRQCNMRLSCRLMHRQLNCLLNTLSVATRKRPTLRITSRR